MRLEEHMESTLLKIGEKHKDLHKMMDQYFPLFRSSLHWVLLHHRAGIDRLEQHFGRKVRRAAEIHCEDDMGFVADSPVDPRLLDVVYTNQVEEFDTVCELLIELFGHDFDFKKAALD